MLIVGEFGRLGRRVGRAVGEQAVEQEDLEQAHGVGTDADRAGRIEIDQACLDVGHAARAERVQRAFTGLDRLLGTDRAVELVFDLQQRGAELAIFVADFDADLFVRRVGLGECAVQRVRVTLQVVIAHGEVRLCGALVAEWSHAQRRAVGQVERAVGECLQRMPAPGDEARAHRGRSTDENQGQPGVTPEVANQREVGVVAVRIGRAAACVGFLQRGPGGLGHREVVMDARDGLHVAAVPVGEPAPVDRLRGADVRVTVAPEWNVLLGGQAAGHARAPQAFVADRARNELVDLGQLLEAGLDAGMHAGDQFELRFAEIGRDVRMGERRAERGRVRRGGKPAVRLHAQAFLFESAPNAAQDLGRQRAEAFFEGHAVSSIWNRSEG